MAINFQVFKRWAEKRFDEIVVKGNNIYLNSIFEPGDDGFHLSCSPSGGLHKRQHGVYRCFKTENCGSLLKLVQIVEKCDHDEALEILGGKTSVRELELQLEEFFNQQEKIVPVYEDIKFPDGTFLISSLPDNDWWKKQAVEYLEKRKIPIQGYYICKEAPYKFRIIIPYYDAFGKLIYWNARALGKSKPKYKGPDKEKHGVGKSDVLYIPGQLPKPGDWVYVCEGEFNAKSLFLSELNGIACGGKSMAEKQAIMLSKYRVVLCLDRDKPGWHGSTLMSSMISSLSMLQKDNIWFVRPCEPYNDWNDMFVGVGPAVLYYYIEKNKKQIDFQAPGGMTGDYFKFQDL